MAIAKPCLQDFKMSDINMNLLSHFLEGVQNFRVIGDPSSWVEVRIYQFPVVVSVTSQMQYSTLTKATIHM